MSDSDPADRHYAGGHPNPDEMGIDPVASSAKQGRDEDAIRRTARELGRAVQDVDAEGYEREIIAAAVSPRGDLAWVESRARQRGEWMDVAFHLRARVGGRLALEWEVETYNPYFGCVPGHLAWWGDRIVFIYREKHETIAATIPVGGPPGLLAIDDDWELREHVLTYVGEDEDLVEVRILPHLKRGHPLPNEFSSSPVRADALALPQDAESFRREFSKELFAFSKPSQLEADLIVGALAYPFWDPGTTLAATYDERGRRWTSPRWLPLYWALRLDEEQRTDFRMLLRPFFQVSARKTADLIGSALRAVNRRMNALADACEAGRLPQGVVDTFWSEWALAQFEKDLGIFPAGFREAYELLKPERERWDAVGRASTPW